MKVQNRKHFFSCKEEVSILWGLDTIILFFFPKKKKKKKVCVQFCFSVFLFHFVEFLYSHQIWFFTDLVCGFVGMRFLTTYVKTISCKALWLHVDKHMSIDWHVCSEKLHGLCLHFTLNSFPARQNSWNHSRTIRLRIQRIMCWSHKGSIKLIVCQEFISQKPWYNSCQKIAI